MFSISALVLQDRAVPHVENAKHPLRNHWLNRHEISPSCNHEAQGKRPVIPGEIVCTHHGRCLIMLSAWTRQSTLTNRCQPQIVRNLIPDHLLQFFDTSCVERRHIDADLTDLAG